MLLVVAAVDQVVAVGVGGEILEFVDVIIRFLMDQTARIVRPFLRIP